VLAAKSGQFVYRSTVSQMLEDEKSLAAINVAFFDIGSTQATQGLVIRDGDMLREPQPGRPSLFVTDANELALGEATWQARVHLGKQRRPIAGVNRPQLGGDEIVIYRLPWSRSPGSFASFSRGQKVREIHIGPVTSQPADETDDSTRLAGPILEIRENGEPIPLKENHIVLTASEAAAPFFRDAAVGQEVVINWKLADLPEGLKHGQIAQAVSAQPILVREGKLVSGGGKFWTTRHPRSAVAIHPDRRHVLLLVVDGRSKASAGMALGTLGKYLLHLGAHEAMNFDGGGSSAIGIRVNGKTQILNTPSDGRERPFPTGLGLVADD
jgi:hypothetical protein